MHATHIPAEPPRKTLPRPSGARWALLSLPALAGVGVLLFTVLGSEPERIWPALLFNWLFWSSLAMGMVVFAAALHMSSATWAWSLRRVALGAVAFLPISFVALIVVFFGSEHYFHHWLPVLAGEVHDPVIERKAAWLNLPGLITRDLLLVAILYGVALAFGYFSLRPDLPDEGRPGLHGWLARGWRGAGAEAARCRRVVDYLAPVLTILFAVVLGIIAIDLAMSLEPHWFSTMFPVAFFVAAFQGGIAASAIAVTALRPSAGLEPYFGPRQYHDLGKLVFAFSVFWMYINWSQYIVIWYGLLEWEQAWMVARLSEPYRVLVGAVVIFVFVLPFAGLLTRPPKKAPVVLACFSAVILLGHWLERFLLVMPSLWEGEGLPLGLPEIGVGAGFGGLFLLSYVWFVSTFPLLPSSATLAAWELETELPRQGVASGQ
ncbi:MAG: hypothetical protein ACREKN_04205 [Longimicrobiaceae bacterium]